MRNEAEGNEGNEVTVPLAWLWCIAGSLACWVLVAWAIERVVYQRDFVPADDGTYGLARARPHAAVPHSADVLAHQHAAETGEG